MPIGWRSCFGQTADDEARISRRLAASFKGMSRILPFLVFLAVALSLIGGMHYYVWARLVRDPHLPPLAARLLTVAIVTLGVSLPLALVASRFLGGPAVRPAVWVAFVWMGIGFLLVAFLGIAD